MMSAADDTLRAAHDDPGGQGQVGHRQVDIRDPDLAARRRVLWALGATLFAAVAIHHATFLSMGTIWLRSDTFLHGILIFPISVFLVVRRWPVLRGVPVQRYPPALVALLAVTGVWWLSDLLGVQVGAQFAVVAMLPLLVLIHTGPAFTRAIAFPLAYLVFAVPFGEAIIPYLIDFTALFTVEALQLIGLPVLRDGAFFYLPSGNFEVAKACSGIRYLLASLALGTLYGYMIFASVRKRLAFFAFAMLLPIVANGIRAYGIVLLAHFSDMKIAVGIDHLIFGWIFFGVVMLLMFWVGDRFRDRRDDERDSTAAGARGNSVAPAGDRRLLPSMLLSLVIAGVGPVLASGVQRLGPDDAAAGLPAGAGDWHLLAEPATDWRPRYAGASHYEIGGYARGGDRVDLAVVRYDAQRQGGELANATNSVADPATWRFGRTENRVFARGAAAPIPVRETTIHRPHSMRLVWFWHEVDGQVVIGDARTKLRELGSILRLRLPVSAAIVLSVPVAGDVGIARDRLQAFLEAALPAIRACLYDRERDAKDCVAEAG